MATAKANVIVGGKKVDPYHVSVQQRCDWHHQFEIAVSTEKIEGLNSLTIDNSVDYIGQTAELSIDCATGKFKFKGLITSVHIDRSYTGDSLVVLSGHSPTYLLEDGVGTKSYEEKDLAAIANEILGTYPANLLNPNVSPQYTTPIPYVVRYKETNYQFLARLAAIYGEWFYYDGEGLVFGKLPNPESVTVTLGKDLDSFDYGVRMRPSKFKYQFYNYQENRMVENVSTSFKPGWLDNYGKKALDAADGMFPNEPTNPVWHDAPNDALIKHLAEAHRGSILSDSAFFKGQSTHAGIKPGGRIQAKGINKIGKANVPGMIGNFRITAVTHHLDANKNYRNIFEAIPMTVTAPPMNKNVLKPEAESQVAVVKENNDPEKLGRIRVQFKWQTGSEMTPWIRQVTNYASGDRGTYFVPEIGDEAYMDFEQGNPERPYMVGAKYHVNTPPEFFDPDNNLKAIKTRSGHTILFSDEAGGESITINDKNGNKIYIDTVANSITVTALEDMTFNAKNMYLNVGESMTTNVGDNMSTTVGKNIKRSAGQNISISAGKSMSTNAGENIGMQASDKMNIGATDIQAKAGSKMNLISDSGTLHANNELRVQAKSRTRISAKKVFINKS